MRNAKRVLQSLACTLALLANGAVIASAQQQRERQPAPRAEQDVLVERDKIMIAPVPPPGFELPLQGGVVFGGPDDHFSFSFVSSEMAFDSRIIRGAPFSAESVTESVQVLADGNRITRKTTAKIHRDGEGRTRRDQTLNAVGPFATAEDAQQTVFINDPVAGVNYVLNPRTRTAHKAMQYSYKITRLEGEPKMPPTAETPAAAAQGSPKLPIAAGLLNSRAKKGPVPVYPAVARAARAEGRVTVEVVVNEDGRIESARALDGHPLLREAAVDAARQWEFEPTRLEGKPVKVAGRISFNFLITKGDLSGGAEQQQEQEPPLPAKKRTPFPADPASLPRFAEATDSLGKQMIEGVEAEGTRTVVTIPAGAIGNERAIQITSERWYSPDLQTVVMTRHSDPRFGETTYRLTNITRGEPDRTLFEVPPGFQITTGGPFKRGPAPAVQMRKPKIEQ